MKNSFTPGMHEAEILQQLRARSGLAAQGPDRAADGSFVLVYGPRVRIRLFPLAGGAIVLEAHLSWLPPGSESQSRMLASLLQFVSQRPAGEDAAWVPRPDGTRVVMQARVEEFDGVWDLQQRIDDFVQLASAWRSQLPLHLDSPMHACHAR